MQKMAGVAGLEPENESSPIFAKMCFSPVFIGDYSLPLFSRQTVFAKKTEGLLSPNCP
jgi:hypothetical protein